MFKKSITVGAVGKWNVKDLGVFERLLHPSADGVIVVFRFDDSDRDAGLVEEKVVRLLGFTALNRLATHDDTTLREIDLLPKLGHHIPLSWTGQRWGNELGADVRFGELFLIHSPDPICAE